MVYIVKKCIQKVVYNYRKTVYTNGNVHRKKCIQQVVYIVKQCIQKVVYIVKQCIQKVVYNVVKDHII